MATIDLTTLPLSFDVDTIFDKSTQNGALAQIKAPSSIDLLGSAVLSVDTSGELERFVENGSATKSGENLQGNVVNFPTQTLQKTIAVPKKLFKLYNIATGEEVDIIDRPELTAEWATTPQASKLLKLLFNSGVNKAGRALDYLAGFGVEPTAPQTTIAGLPNISQSSKTVQASTGASASVKKDLIAAAAALGLGVSGVAMSSNYRAGGFGENVNGIDQLPTLGVFGIGSWGGAPVVSSDTFDKRQAQVATSANTPVAFAGEFEQGLQWGVAGLNSLEIFRERAGGIDLADQNKYGVRFEIYLNARVDLDKFVVINGKGTKSA